jgi:lambda family phage portal protein
MARARSLVASNALAASGLAAWESGLIATGATGRSKAVSRAARTRIDRAFAKWGRACDADGICTFEALQSLVTRRMIVDGEALVLLIVRDGKLRLRCLPSEALSTISRQLPGGGQIAEGIEIDAEGRRVAYHIFPDRPGALPATTPVRISAEDVLHIYRADYPAQLRGVSWFAPILLSLAEHGKLSDAVTMQQQVAAMLTGFVRTADGDGGSIFSGERSGNEIVPSLEPGTMAVLENGQDVIFSTPPKADGAKDVLKLTARQISSGLGVSYEMLTGDLSEVNYSSIRAGIVEFRRKCDGLQYNLITPRLLDPIFARFVTVEALANRLYAPGNLDAYLEAEWYFPRQAWVDPAKDIAAEVMAIGAGLKSRSESLAERGWSAEDVDAQIAADRAREKALGLNFAQNQEAANGR